MLTALQLLCWMFGCSSAREALTEERLAGAVRVDMEERLDAPN